MHSIAKKVWYLTKLCYKIFCIVNYSELLSSICYYIQRGHSYWIKHKWGIIEIPKRKKKKKKSFVFLSSISI